MRQPFVLIGLMGAGKTRLGKMLAARTGMPFYDSDAVIEAEYGTSITDIFAQHGETFFRDLEYKTFDRLLDGSPKIIAAGGGVVVPRTTRELLRARACPIWLQADVPTLVARCTGSHARPLLRQGDPAEILTRLLDIRTPLYEATARHTIRTDDVTPEEALERLATLTGKEIPTP